jgi:hypothetical protein
MRFVDAERFKAGMSQVAGAMWVVATWDEDRPWGVTARRRNRKRSKAPSRPTALHHAGSDGQRASGRTVLHMLLAHLRVGENPRFFATELAPIRDVQRLKDRILDWARRPRHHDGARRR